MEYYLYFFSLIMFVFVENANANRCPEATVCYCDKKAKSATCFHTTLNVIPKLPKYVTDLFFSGNLIATLNSSTLRHLDDLKLQRLKLDDNIIEEISADAFSRLKYIQDLDLSKNPKMKISDVAESVVGIPSSYFSSINLQNLMWHDEPIQLYMSLSKFKILNLDLEGSNFKTLNFTFLSECIPHVERLSFAHGSISTILPGFLLNLKILALHKNFLDISIKNGFFVNKTYCYFPNLEHLDLDQNLISDYGGLFDCFQKLRILSLAFNPVKIIGNDTFARLPLLEVLSVSNIGDRLEVIESYAFRCKTLKRLDISDNNFLFMKSNLNKTFDDYNIFRCAPAIQDLDLTANYFDPTDVDIFPRMILPLISLRRLRLDRCKFNTLPANIFYKLTNLEVLSISYNKISSWNGQKVFGNGTTLHTIQLKNNNIAVVNESLFPMNALKQLSTIDLADNPFTCSCENQWFLNWTRHHPDMFEPYPFDYNCKTPVERENMLISDYYPSDCNSRSQEVFTSIVTCFSVFGIVFTIIVSVLYRMRWHIRYWMYLNHVKKTGFSMLSENNDTYLYDAFVIYCDEDVKWIYQKLVHRIETDTGLKLCIHHRDFEAGKVIVENIIEKMSNSKKIIVVVSRDMVKSDWCLFETRVAQERFLNREAYALVTIMLENIPKQEIASSLRSLVNSTTYIEWPRKEYEEDNFWTEVLRILRRN